MRKRIEPPAKAAKKKAGGGRVVEAGIADSSLVGNRPVNFDAARPAPEHGAFPPPWATPRDGHRRPTKQSDTTGPGGAFPAPLD